MTSKHGFTAAKQTDQTDFVYINSVKNEVHSSVESQGNGEPVRGGKIRPTPQENGEVKQRITTRRDAPRGFHPRSGASPKLVLGHARQVELGFGCTDFLRCLFHRSTSVCLNPFLVACCGREFRGL